MTALIDTNVILDVMLRREPFFTDSANVLNRAERGDFTAWLCATTITTLFYLVRRHLGTTATIGLEDLTAIFGVATVNRSVIEAALQSPFSDFEDAVLNHSALTVGAECIVTRNTSDFRHSSLLIYTPAQFLAALS